MKINNKYYFIAGLILLFLAPIITFLLKDIIPLLDDLYLYIISVHISYGLSILAISFDHNITKEREKLILFTFIINLILFLPVSVLLILGFTTEKSNNCSIKRWPKFLAKFARVVSLIGVVLVLFIGLALIFIPKEGHVNLLIINEYLKPAVSITCALYLSSFVIESI